MSVHSLDLNISDLPTFQHIQYFWLSTFEIHSKLTIDVTKIVGYATRRFHHRETFLWLKI